MRHLISKAAAAVVAVALIAAPATRALAQDKDDDVDPNAPIFNCQKAKGQVSVSFKSDIELKDLLTWAMGFTCKNFIYEQGVLSRSKKLTIIAPNKMTAEQAYRLFLVGLSTMGLTVVPKGNVLKVVESGQAKGETVAIKRGAPAATEEFVRLILRPNNVGAQDVADALMAVKSVDGDIKVISKAGIVLVTDYGSHVKDMVTLTREIDKPSDGAGVYTIKVIYADAKQLADMLGQVLGTTAAAGGAGAAQSGPVKGGGRTAADIEAAVPSKILADDRTNSLILVSNEAAYLRVRALVKRLDVPLETEGSGSIHVHPLENAKAEELAQTLNNAMQGISQPSAGGQPQPPRGRQRADAQAQVHITGPEGAAFEGTVKITHDTPTNSLVIISSVRDFLALRQVIEKLDAPRRQVFIEAVILELQATNDLSVGTSWHGGIPTDDGGVGLLGLQHATLRSLDITTLASATGLIGGLLGELLEEAQPLLGVSIPSYGVLFQALAKNRNANVLSSPHILTTDNTEAEISVGQNIPFLGAVSLGGLGGTAGGLTGFAQQSIQRQDIALTMKITPHVNQSDMIRLDIEQEIQDVGERDPELGPTWTKRKIKTTVVVRDQQSIVIGGLMSDRVTYTESKIPLLGDIPILGYLFKFTEKTKQKTNLLVLLTPYIVEDQVDIERIVQRKVRERSEFLRSFSAFDTAKYLPQLDYRKKRGLLEEINTTIEAVEGDILLLRSLDQEGFVIPDGPVRYTEPPPEGEPTADVEIQIKPKEADEPKDQGEVKPKPQNKPKPKKKPTPEPAPKSTP
jgi:general secretion pathway protein D